MKAALFSKTTLRDCALLLLLAAAPALLAGWLHPKHPVWAWQKPGVDELELNLVTRWQPPPLWVDAREREAYEQAHIPGAILLNETEWDQLLPAFLAAWQPSGRVVVYCNAQQCDASQAVALRLQRDLNLSDIFVLKGGWSSWQQAKH